MRCININRLENMLIVDSKIAHYVGGCKCGKALYIHVYVYAAAWHT